MSSAVGWQAVNELHIRNYYLEILFICEYSTLCTKVYASAVIKKKSKNYLALQVKISAD